MQSFLSILVIVAVSVVNKVSANTAGTGSCAAGIAAIGGSHLDYGPNTVPFKDGGFGSLAQFVTTVQLGGTTLVAGVPSTFPANTDLTWTVTAGQAPTTGQQLSYKGIFVRVQADTSNSFTNVGTQTDLQNVMLCDALTENVVGVSHTNAAAKTTNSGVLNFSAGGPATMDISIVFINDNVASFYAFSSFPITIGTGTPVAAPVSTPVAAPVATPVAAPVVAAPTGTAPVATPPTAEPPAPTGTDAECPDDGKGKGKGGKGGMMGMMSMKCKGGMMMGMETKSPKSPKTPKSGEGKGKGSNTTDTGKGKGDGRVRYLN
jgi:hypothetical protein